MSLASYKKCVQVSDESRTVSGREFHSDGPETLKLRCPYLARLHRGTSKSPHTADRKPCRTPRSSKNNFVDLYIDAKKRFFTFFTLVTFFTFLTFFIFQTFFNF